MDAHSGLTLLALARTALQEYLIHGTLDPPPGCLPAWPDPTPRGLFVTLTRGGRLRGCIGTFAPRHSLPDTVWEMAIAAAQDPRFVDHPVAATELPALRIELSVLSPLWRTRRPEEDIRIGVHGIYVRRGPASGCFLPQVAEEYGWSAAEFLSCCCDEKAGLPPDAWRDPATEVELFTVEKLVEAS